MGKTWLVAVSMGALFMLGACAGNESGSCSPACGESQACCDDMCTFTISDTQNCGACGNVCAAGQACTNGVCTGGTGMDGGGPPIPNNCSPECAASQRCCGGVCSDFSTPPGVDGRTTNSFQNCNGCGIACDADRALSCSVPGGGMGTARCMCGDLDQCLPGTACVQINGIYTCSDLNSDTQNCGAVGNACAEGESCVGGVCGCGSTGASCAAGQACCGGACIDTSADAMNCGGCGNVCTPAAPDCQAGSCTCGGAPACRAPMPGPLGLPLGADPGQSCCPGMGCVDNTADSCACAACADGEECAVGGSLLPGMGGDGPPTVCCAEGDFGGLSCGLLGGGFPGLGDGGLPGLGDGGLPFP